MQIALGADHAGIVLKSQIKEFLDKLNLTYKDFGAASDESVDYPDYAASVAHGVSVGSFDRGILICGSGIGMAITANKFRGVRAAPVYTIPAARLCREHNNINVLTLGSRMLETEQALQIVETFLMTPFGEGRHQHRIDKITAIEDLKFGGMKTKR